MMAVWSEADAAADTLPPVENAEPTALLARMLPKAAEALDNAAVALLRHDDELDAHDKRLDRIGLSAERWRAAHVLTCATDVVAPVFLECGRLALGQDLEEWGIADLPRELLRMRDQVAEGHRAEHVDDRVKRLRFAAQAMRSWREELDR